MRRSNASRGPFSFIYPDEVCFAYNPNYVEIIGSTEISSVVVEASISLGSKELRKKEITVALYASRAKVYLSRLYEMMFEEPEVVRSFPIMIKIHSADKSVTYFSFVSIVIWGCLAPGERLNSFGVFNNIPNKPHFERNLIWFKNFPFCFSIFRMNGDTSIKGRYDRNSYDTLGITARRICSISSIDEISSPYVENIGTSSPSSIIYFSAIRRLLAEKSGRYFGTWSGYPTFSDSSMMVDAETNLPKTNVDFQLSDKDGFEWLYHFNGADLVKSQLSQVNGFINIYPEDYYPNARLSATFAMNVSSTLLSTFDHTFDYTFNGGLDESAVLINLQVSHETEGFYLRWIDSQGNIQFFLFKKGTDSFKSSLSGTTVEVQKPVRNYYFPNLNRTMNINLSESHKCCAVHLANDIFDYVKTILTSPIIDLYIGKDRENNELWVPVTIEGGTVKYNHREQLHDVEISFQSPSYNAQSL